MQRMFLKIFAIALLTNLAAYGQSQAQPQSQPLPTPQAQPQASPQSQSLGEVARQYRQKQEAQEASGKEPKTFTNKDLPANPEGYQAPPEEQPAQRQSTAMNEPFGNRSSDNRDRFYDNHPYANRSFGDRPGEQRYGGQRGPEEWRQAIQEQENRMANLQARIDQLNMAIRERGGTVQYDGPVNRNQARQLERVAQMQQMLEEQRRRLDQMQDAARHAGMHTSIYDP
jgi:hypothetical protein